MDILDTGHALVRFRRELVDMGIPSSERTSYLNEFKRWFERSQNYDLAVDRVFEQVMSRATKKQTFKNYWNNSITKQQSDESEAVEIAQRVYDENKGIDWSKILIKIIKTLVVGLGISVAIALRSASKVQRH